MISCSYVCGSRMEWLGSGSALIFIHGVTFMLTALGGHSSMSCSTARIFPQDRSRDGVIRRGYYVHLVSICQTCYAVATNAAVNVEGMCHIYLMQ
jgi:hypothetical protein